MLTNETKQRINTCRDILVGKLPDPKSQVIQITNALIYKFMDDQDRLAEKLGGKASFFVKELKPYAWHKLFDSKLTNQDRADLYVEGVQKLSEAKHLPELFQEIFKEAYVPFRAAQTITLFITEINKFDYNHSEELGNAYEYLLSIMGSQGDAGQFRTPRHIIEFMVDIIDPQKGETVYDPACGTAGFLIAAYTHILEANNGKLSASERKKLGENISGIDISPDMAKMARVNLYLHGFSSPVINEGDTLSDEDLWGTKYDVILANPPFMSPKGGIIPHDKFGIKAKRAEVLFVDYIAEHLKLKGRAAIVVPEGVIFQSGTTYKALRKMLVEDGYLHSVISLPAGVFQPYSGVKTSILILDREKAKVASEVLFLKIENDGYSLSTQRTVLTGDELPEALTIARAWQEGKKQEASIASWVTKKEIAESGDYSLTGERYRTFEARTSSWPLVPLKDICNIKTGKKDVNQGNSDGEYPFFTCAKEHTFSDSYSFDTEALLIAGNGDVGAVKYYKGKFEAYQRTYILDEFKGVHPVYLYHLLHATLKPFVSRLKLGNTMPYIKLGMLQDYEIPLPPIKVQQEIVAELDRYQKIIDGARQVVTNYKPSFKIDPEWNISKLGDQNVLTVIDGDRGTNYPKKEDFSQEGYCLFLNTSNVRYGVFNFEKRSFINKEKDTLLRKGKLVKGDVVLTTRGTLGNTALYSEDVPYEHLRINSGMVILRPNTKYLTSEYLLEYLNSDNFIKQVERFVSGSAQPQLPIRIMSQIEIPLPKIEVQQKIVESLRDEKRKISETELLVSIFEQKIQDKIAEVWGE